MTKVKIVKKRKYNFEVKDKWGYEYDLVMFFEDVDYEPQKGDCLFISNDILSDFEEVETPKFYGPFSMKAFVRKPEKMTDVDFIVVVNDNGMHTYQRYYG